MGCLQGATAVGAVLHCIAGTPADTAIGQRKTELQASGPETIQCSVGLPRQERGGPKKRQMNFEGVLSG